MKTPSVSPTLSPSSFPQSNMKTEPVIKRNSHQMLKHRATSHRSIFGADRDQRNGRTVSHRSGLLLATKRSNSMMDLGGGRRPIVTNKTRTIFQIPNMELFQRQCSLQTLDCNNDDSMSSTDSASMSSSFSSSICNSFENDFHSNTFHSVTTPSSSSTTRRIYPRSRSTQTLLEKHRHLLLTPAAQVVKRREETITSSSENNSAKDSNSLPSLTSIWSTEMPY